MFWVGSLVVKIFLLIDFLGGCRIVRGMLMLYFLFLFGVLLISFRNVNGF